MAALALLLGLSAAIPSSCSHRSGRVRFEPGETFEGRERNSPAFESAPRARTQHTFDTVGESLFPCPGADGALHFASSRQGPSFSIVKKTKGNSPLTMVTGGPHNDIHPALSPDGKRLAFSSDREGPFGIYLREEGAGVPERRLSGPGGDAFGPSWSPDSRRLAYFRRGVKTESWEVWIVDAEGGTEEYLCPGLFPSWSPAGPDGEWIAYQEARQRDGDWYSIWKVRPDGSRPTELVLNGTWGAVHPSWSPDGRWIAFAAVGKGPQTPAAASGSRPSTGDIYLITAEGARLTDLTGGHGGISEWNPAFGPDGRIYFNSDEGGSVNIWSLDPGIGKSAPLAAPPPRAPPRAKEAARPPAGGAQAIEAGLGAPVPAGKSKEGSRSRN